MAWQPASLRMREQALQAPRYQKYHRVTQAISIQLQLQVQTCKTGNQEDTTNLAPIFDLEKVSSIYTYLKTTLLINISFHKQRTQSYLSSFIQTFQQLNISTFINLGLLSALFEVQTLNDHHAKPHRE